MLNNILSMPEDDLDLPIDGEFEEKPAPQRKSVRRKAARRPVAKRRRTVVYAPEEESYTPARRPHIAIHAATSAPKKVNLYRRLSLLFLTATVAVIGVIVFFTFQRATIDVAFEAVPVASALTVTVGEGITTSTTAFSGIVVAVTTSTEKVFYPTATSERPGKARGAVTVYNESGSPQPLVSTTRFLSEKGVLFRLVRAVTVPANGSVTAELVADKAGKDGDTVSGRFTIPGLNSSQQKKVYGVSTVPMTGGAGKVGVVTQQDIDKASEEVRKALFDRGQRFLAMVVVPEGHEVLHTPVNIKVVPAVKAGEETGAFTVRASGTMAVVAYPKVAVFAAADRDVQTKSPTPYHKVTFINEAPTVSLKSLDVATKSAQLQLYREGRAILDERSGAFQPVQFMGRSAGEIADQLKSIRGVTMVKTQFFPPWMERAPKVPSRITVTFEEKAVR